VTGADSAWLATWLPPGIGGAMLRIDAVDLDERAAAAGLGKGTEAMLPGRRREHLAGRLAARAALLAHGADDARVGRSGDAPVWPPGWCGSISHSGGLALAVVARSTRWRSIGVDVEPQITGRRIRVVEAVMTADERAAASLADDPWVWTRAWAAKEAVWKCLSAQGCEPGFEDIVPRWVEQGHGVLVARVRWSAADVVVDARVHAGLAWSLARVEGCN
jgi:4'-phosphopantetheinyl transferase EntD